jgi:membrane-associated phospholipid phosphatase
MKCGTPRHYKRYLPGKYRHVIIATMTGLTIIIAQYLIFAVGLGAVIAALLAKKRVRNNIIKLAILSFFIAFLVAYVAGLFYYDTVPLILHQPDNGFPSDHTLAAMVTAATIFVYRRKVGIILGVSGIGIGIARIAAQLHHPIDVASSVVIAIIAVYCAWLILRRLDRSFRDPA